MTFTEKQTDPTAPLHWRGDMQADYFYPNGVAGDKFFKHLKTKESFLATYCKHCKKTLFPPRMYCEDCYEEIPEEDWKEVPAAGVVRLFTIVKLNAEGEYMQQPKILALINIDGTDGSMFGIINSRDYDKDFSGAKVKAVFRPTEQREGTLKDILHFNLV